MCKKPPLVIDLDGTLVKSNMLHESALSIFFKKPFLLFFFSSWLIKGKAHIKKELASHFQFNPQTLPYNEDLFNWLKLQKLNGRKLILCTASDHFIANSIASYLDIFDDVIASDGFNNLTGKNKAKILIDRFGIKGFDYVGNSAADLHVWEFANKGIIVNASDRIVSDASAYVDIELVLNNPKSNELLQWFKALRLHQWIKNFLLFIPFLASHQVLNISILSSLFMAFISFSLCASSVYLMNDLSDLENDRNHPRKSKRPFANGSLELWQGLIVAPILLLTSFILSKNVNASFMICLAIYFTFTCLYSLKLKEIAIIDSITLAVLYTLRIIAGSLAISLSISFWILAFSLFLFLSLAFVKRFAELQLQFLYGKHQAIGRNYSTNDAPLIEVLGIVSGLLSSLVLAFYLNSQKVAELYSSPELIWGCIPVLIFWISWVWLQAHRGKMHDDPLVFALQDKASLISGFFFVAFLIMGSTL